MNDALVLCEGRLDTPTGKTARGLVRYSKRYRIVGVLDSTCQGRDAGEVVDGRHRDIPVFGTLEEALGALSGRPGTLIVGVATIGGRLPQEFRGQVITALENGMDVVAGLHEFLGEDPELRALARRNGAQIIDIRREPPLERLHGYRNLASGIDSVRLAVLGTDSAVGKRTTAIELTEALNARGVRSEFVATGQTGLLQGARYGVPLDSIQGDYVVGELETAIYDAYMNEDPEVIVVEGQGAFQHPAYVCGTRAILSALRPNAIVMQHAPGRKYRNYDPELRIPLPDLEEEISLLEAFAKTEVIALGVNPEGLSEENRGHVIQNLEKRFRMPAVDVYREGANRLAEAVLDTFPRLRR
ncbi:MAG: DUF1611 domain-containing protein [Methanomassiliicoccales archaeon]